MVLDASAGVELLRWSAAGRRVADVMASESETIHVPHLFAVEVAQVMRRLEAQGVVGEERAAQAIADLADLDLIRHEHELLLERVWSLRPRITAYDAVYVALAEGLGAPLHTMDRRLASAVGDLIEVELLV